MFARIFTIVMIVSSAAVAEPDPPRQPTGQWVVDYAENMCVLQRAYGGQAERLTLALKPHPMSDRVALYVFDSPAKLKGDYVPLQIGFGPGFPNVEANMETFDVPAESFRYNYTELSRPELERAVASGMISLHGKGRINLALRVPGLRKALGALDECVADLLVQWEFSREQQQTLAKLAEPAFPLHRYVTSGDYPTTAIMAGETGVNSARFTIDRNGRVGNCMIVESSGSSELDTRICRVTKRFRFRPAIDRAGQPMESVGYYRIRWALSS